MSTESTAVMVNAQNPLRTFPVTSS